MFSILLSSFSSGKATYFLPTHPHQKGGEIFIIKFQREWWQMPVCLPFHFSMLKVDGGCRGLPKVVLHKISNFSLSRCSKFKTSSCHTVGRSRRPAQTNPPQQTFGGSQCFRPKMRTKFGSKFYPFFKESMDILNNFKAYC